MITELFVPVEQVLEVYLRCCDVVLVIWCHKFEMRALIVLHVAQVTVDLDFDAVCRYLTIACFITCSRYYLDYFCDGVRSQILNYILFIYFDVKLMLNVSWNCINYCYCYSVSIYYVYIFKLIYIYRFKFNYRFVYIIFYITFINFKFYLYKS